MPSSSTQSAWGSQSSRKRAAADGHGRSLSSVPHTIRTGQVMFSTSRLQPSRRASSISCSAASQPAAPRSWWSSSSAGMCSKLVVSSCVARRPRGQNRLGVRRGCRRQLVHRALKAEQGLVGLVALRPNRRPARAPQRSRHARVRRVAAPHSRPANAGEVGALKTGFVHRPLDRISEHGAGHLARQRRPAGMSGQRHGQDVVGRSSAGRASSHIRHMSMKPWRHTSGGLQPAR
jgi:hypothetical protein